jgi:hypothetical protein
MTEVIRLFLKYSHTDPNGTVVITIVDQDDNPIESTPNVRPGDIIVWEIWDSSASAPLGGIFSLHPTFNPRPNDNSMLLFKSINYISDDLPNGKPTIYSNSTCVAIVNPIVPEADNGAIEFAYHICGWVKIGDENVRFYHDPKIRVNPR